MLWYPNRGGVLSINAQDELPPIVRDGDEFPAQRLTITHNGSMADLLAELTSIEVLLYDASGTLVGRATADLPAGPLAPDRVLDFEARLEQVETAATARFDLRGVGFLEGEPGRRTARWALRALLGWRARSRWLACYCMDSADDATRQRFLERVGRELARV